MKEKMGKCKKDGRLLTKGEIRNHRCIKKITRCPLFEMLGPSIKGKKIICDNP